MRKERPWLLFLTLCVVLVASELLCAELAYETLGEVDRSVYHLVIALNVPLLLLAIWRTRAAAVGIVALALLIVPYQVVLGQRLWRVQNEADHIVHYAYQQKLATGQFPETLDAYVYRNPRISRYIQTYRSSEEAGGFVLAYRVGTEHTSHSYSPRNGWSYYPD